MSDLAGGEVDAKAGPPAGGAARAAEAREAETREVEAPEVEAPEAAAREPEARDAAAREAGAREAAAREAGALRARVLRDPGLVLNDAELMRAILKAEGRSLGRKVVDLRGVLVDRLEERIDRLEDTHREVLAAAYDNVAGTAQVHRAVLALLEAEDFGAFLRVLTDELPRILQVDVVRLGLEAPAAEPGAPLGPEDAREAVVALPAGGAATYVTAGRGGPVRPVVLRALARASATMYGAAAGEVHSEAALLLDLGPKRLPGILAMGAADPERFHPEQGTDLLTFFAGVFARGLRRWLD